MILATLKDGTKDGRLIVVSPARDAFAYAPVWTMQEAVEGWDAFVAAAAAVDQFPEALDPAQLAAPMPRAWQWLDGSAFSTHGELMQIAFHADPIESDRPLMYQGMSDRFFSATDYVPFPSEADGIDFEGEFGVIVDFVPMGTSAEEAMKHIRLLVQINDWSLRAIAPVEMKTGFGWVQAKPACSMAPFAITPDEIGEYWRDGCVCLDLNIDWNGKSFGHANGEPMAFGFGELVAHAARTRDLVAGTIIGSGTVSNPDYAEVGSSCISEVRAIEIIAEGAPKTGFMKFGDTLRMEAVLPSGDAPFGVIDQKVVRSQSVSP